MVALSDAGTPELWELGKLGANHLNRILDEETRLWRDCLDWDFRLSADLVRRFVRLKALRGYALAIGGEPIGYSYFVCEEGKGLIGDLYVLDRFRCLEYENRLLDAVLESMISTPNIKRVEAQLMVLASPFNRPVPRSGLLRRHPRSFMVTGLDKAGDLAPGQAAGKVRIEGWSHDAHEKAARLIAASYRGHVDSEINDQYRSVAGARRFLMNIVQYPGCGSFFLPGSYMALRGDTGELCGISLGSLISTGVGHITQICTSPSVRGAGVGYELLRRSLRGLAGHGCRKASLTVTSANTEAIRLYERMGFTTARTFAAYVWEGF